MKKKALGKGLSALFQEMGGDEPEETGIGTDDKAERRATTGGAKENGAGKGGSEETGPEEAAPAAGDLSPRKSGVTTLSLTEVVPASGQPRREFDEGKLQELADSIGAKGVLQPILVRPVKGGLYEIVAGERRWRASRMAGLTEIPAVVREFSDVDSFEAALIENVQREDLNPIEEAGGYQKLIRTYGHTQEMIAALTGKARSHIANLLRLLDLPDMVQQLLAEGAIRVGHAKAILSAEDPEALAEQIVAGDLSVREAEKLARRRRPKVVRPKKAASIDDADVAALEMQLSETTGAAISIRPKGQGGQIMIRYADLTQLDRIVGMLQG